MVDEPGAPDITAAFARYEPYGIVPEGWMDQLRHVRESCPVVHSDGCGGFWLVTRHDDVARILMPRATPIDMTTDAMIPMPTKRNMSMQPFRTVYMRPARSVVTSLRPRHIHTASASFSSMLNENVIALVGPNGARQELHLDGDRFSRPQGGAAPGQPGHRGAAL